MAAVAHISPAGVRRLVIVRTGPVVPAAPARVAVSTYRRRRAVALLAVATAVVVVVLALSGLTGPSGGGAPAASKGAGGTGAVYVVQPGDTFWDIARRLHPADDPRPLVARLVAEHGSPVLVAGERLRLPGGA